MGWGNRSGPVRNGNEISDFALIFFINVETRNKLEEIDRGLRKMCNFARR
jgi:hypothetical protein